MTVTTHIAEILRQGIWASLTGGWWVPFQFFFLFLVLSLKIPSLKRVDFASSVSLLAVKGLSEVSSFCYPFYATKITMKDVLVEC